MALTLEDTQNIIDNLMNTVLKEEERYEFLDLVSRFTDYSLENNLLIFEQAPYAEYLAGAGEWVKSGRLIKRKCEGKEITLLLPVFKILSKGTRRNTKGIVMLGAYDEIVYSEPPRLEYRTESLCVYDCEQTTGNEKELIDNVIGEVPNIPERFSHIIRGATVKPVPIENPELNGGLSYFSYEDDEEMDSPEYYPELFVSDKLNDSEQDIEIVKAIIRYKYDNLLNNGFFSAQTPAKEGECMIATYLVLTHYGYDAKDIPLVYCNNIDEMPLEEKKKVMSDIIYLANKVICELDNKNYMSLELIISLQQLTPIMLINSNVVPYIARIKSLCVLLFQIQSVITPKEASKSVNRIFEDIKEYMCTADEASLQELYTNIKELKLSNYPRMYFCKKKE